MRPEIRTDLLLVWLHVCGNLVWIGAIVAVAVVLLGTGEPRERGAQALRIYLRAAVPAFLLSFGAGLVRLMMDTEHYFVTTHFMHAKLLVALAVIGLHHAIGGRAKKMAAGTASDAGPVKGMLIGLLVCAAAAAFFVLFQIPK